MSKSDATISILDQRFLGLVELLELEVEVLPVLGQVHVVDRGHVGQHGSPETDSPAIDP